MASAAGAAALASPGFAPAAGSTFGRSSSGAFGRRRGSDFGGRFRLFRTRRVDRDDHGIALGDRRDRDALRQRQVGQMLGLVHAHLREIQLDELGQILRQAGDFHVGDAVRHHATLPLHARGSGLALEVDRDVDADLLGLDHALHVDVHDGVARRVHLQILDDRGLRLVADLEVDDRGVELLVVDQRHQLLVIESDGTGFDVAPVQDCRHLSRE